MFTKPKKPKDLHKFVAVGGKPTQFVGMNKKGIPNTKASK